MAVRCVNVGQLLPQLQRLVPPFSPSKHKGQAGKVAVVGGCQEYTGAPYFASYSALLVGADLSHVFCEASAAPVIKAYSPELIVHPYLRDSVSDADGDAAGADAIKGWLPRFNAVVVGPGLGRDPALLAAARAVVHECKEAALPLVLDADGVGLVVECPELVKGYPQAVLTPNVNEFRRLAAALGVETGDPLSDAEATSSVAAALAGPALLRKGRTDLICQGDTVLECDEPGSLRRCGGQGDVLAGTLATFLAWAHASGPDGKAAGGEEPAVLAAAAACLVTRRAAAAAFAKHHRAMRASCVMEELGPVMSATFGDD